MTFGAVNFDYRAGRFHRKVDGMVSTEVRMKCDMEKLFKTNKRGKRVPTWRYYLARLLGSVEGKC